ncbi:MAG: methyltransferase domain-containing protein [Candidatus Omnitrophota bacterium]|jgi:SAM-dependent methyltransferase
MNNKIWLDLYGHRIASRTIKKQKWLAGFIKPHHRFFLELFSATGENAGIIKKLNPDLYCIGIDYSFELCKRGKESGYVSINADCKYLPLKKDVFDIVYCNSFHHVAIDVVKVLEDSVALLKKGGLLIGVEPYGRLSKILVNIICLMPNFLISLFPQNFRFYVSAIKYECRNEGVMDWYKGFVQRDFNRALNEYDVLLIRRDALRVYYCIKRN